MPGAGFYLPKIQAVFPNPGKLSICSPAGSEFAGRIYAWHCLR
jgi:hypothetical protein